MCMYSTDQGIKCLRFTRAQNACGKKRTCFAHARTHVLNHKRISHAKQTRDKRDLNAKQTRLLEARLTVSLAVRGLYALLHGLYQHGNLPRLV